jgi:hypothetical protein
MARAGVFALNLATRFPDLLDKDVCRVPFNDSFDPGLLMPRHDNEAGEVRRHAVVLTRRNFDRFNARFGRALAMERKCVLDAVLLCALLDPLVDRTENFLVAGGRLREIHQHIIPPRETSAPGEGGQAYAADAPARAFVAGQTRG